MVCLSIRWPGCLHTETGRSAWLINKRTCCSWTHFGQDVVQGRRKLWPKDPTGGQGGMQHHPGPGCIAARTSAVPGAVHVVNAAIEIDSAEEAEQ